MKKSQTILLIVLVLILAVLVYYFQNNVQASPPRQLTREPSTTEIQCTDKDGDNIFTESYVLVGGGDLPLYIHDSCSEDGKVVERICIGNEPDSFTEPCPDDFACQESACRGVPEWTQTAFLTAPDAEIDDHFGAYVIASEDVLAVGSSHDDDTYVFRKNGNQWVFEQKLEGLAQDVSEDGNVIVAGDLVYRYDSDGESWVLEQELISSGGSVGWPMAISNDVIVAGVSWDDEHGTYAGAAYVFRFNGEQWLEERKLYSSDIYEDDRFGIRVSILGDVIVISAPNDDDRGSNSGSAYVFNYEGGQWVQKQKLLASDGTANDNFGMSLSIEGNTILVGATGYDGLGFGTGAAYVFEFNGTEWEETQILLPSVPVSPASFGGSVAIFGDKAVVGAMYTEVLGVSTAGAAYVFDYDGSTWSEEAMLAHDNPSSGDWFGGSVSINADSVFAGAYYDDSPMKDTGSAFVFQKRCNLPGDFDLDDDVDEDDAEIFAGYLGQTCGE